MVLVDGATCVDIEVTAADFACSTDDDCTYANTGVMCMGTCGCPGGTPVNRAAAARIASELDRASLPRPMGCPAGCGVFGTEHCVGGVCTLCTFSLPRAPGCPSDGG
jgi:hypothetical protein